MSRSVSIWAVLLMGALAAAPCAIARANLKSRRVLPADGAQGVPTNTRIWMIVDIDPSDTGAQMMALRTTDGEFVETTTEVLGTSLIVVTPSDPLELGVSYEIVGPDSTFTVGRNADHTPPGRPEFSVSDIEHSDGECGPASFALLDVEMDGEVLVLDVDHHAELDPESLSGAISDAFPRDRTAVYVGKIGCDSNWTGASRGSTGKVRLAAFDLAGNFSGWTEEQEVVLGCGCEIGQLSGAPVSAGVFAFFVALGSRARQRRRGVARQSD